MYECMHACMYVSPTPALPEAAATGCQALPPTVVDIGTTSQPHQRHRPGDALPGSPHASPVAIALWECFGRPSTRHPMDTGVINTTPVYKQSKESDLT